MNPLEGKTALVTGASSGIGEAIALGLAREGVALALMSRCADRLEGVARRCRESGARAECQALDFADLDALDAAAGAVSRDLGDIDILVHSAGILDLGRVEDVPPGRFLEQFKINALAPYALSRHFLPALRRRKGDIVFINSRAGFVTRPEIVHYCATKHAMKSLADGLRAELHGQEVRVLSIYPGRVATPMQQAVHETRGLDYHPERYMSAAEVADAVINALRMPAHFELADMVVRSHTDSPA